MNSLILRTTARFLLPVLFALSIFILYRGHNLPGGGFIGGLTAASGAILYMLGYGIDRTKRTLKVTPEALMGSGLLLAVSSGFAGLLAGGAYMKGLWLPAFNLPVLGTVHLGTPLVFDIGVYLTVAGFTLLTTFSLTGSNK